MYSRDTGRGNSREGGGGEVGCKGANRKCAGAQGER